MGTGRFARTIGQCSLVEEAYEDRGFQFKGFRGNGWCSMWGFLVWLAAEKVEDSGSGNGQDVAEYGRVWSSQARRGVC